MSGNRDKAKKILDRAKSLQAEPLTLVTKAFTNLVYGHPQLLDQEELEAQGGEKVFCKIYGHLRLQVENKMATKHVFTQD